MTASSSVLPWAEKSSQQSQKVRRRVQKSLNISKCSWRTPHWQVFALFALLSRSLENTYNRSPKPKAFCLQIRRMSGKTRWHHGFRSKHLYFSLTGSSSLSPTTHRRRASCQQGLTGCIADTGFITYIVRCSLTSCKHVPDTGHSIQLVQHRLQYKSGVNL